MCDFGHFSAVLQKGTRDYSIKNVFEGTGYWKVLELEGAVSYWVVNPILKLLILDIADAI